ncbi:MAG: hypothetical protein KatS3mg060_2693 [Dehalococcoidia bacterium]|nr:MAG: hypothetical protein KatS3mg060_2693 [Dehalococcoidia bacterium]
MVHAEMYHLRVCGGPRCAERGSDELRRAFEQALASRGLGNRAAVSRIDGVCHGRCRFGPNVFVSPGDIWYRDVSVADAMAIVEEHVGAGRPVTRLIGESPAFLQLDDDVPW